MKTEIILAGEHIEEMTVHLKPLEATVLVRALKTMSKDENADGWGRQMAKEMCDSFQSDFRKAKEKKNDVQA